LSHWFGVHPWRHNDLTEDEAIGYIAALAELPAIGETFIKLHED